MYYSILRTLYTIFFLFVVNSEERKYKANVYIDNKIEG